MALKVAVAAMLALAGAAAAVPDRPLIFDRVPTAQAVELFYRRVSPSPFVLCSEVLEDQRPVSMRLPGAAVTARAFQTWLRARGYSAQTMEGVTYVCGGNAGRPGAGPSGLGGAVATMGGPFHQGAPQGVASSATEQGGPFAPGVAASAMQSVPGREGARPAPEVVGVYRSLYRDSAELAEYARDLLPGVRVVSVTNVGSGDQNRSSAPTGAELAYAGPADQVKQLTQLLASVDRQPEAAQIEAILVEVSKSQDRAWGLGIVADVLSDQLGIRVRGAGTGGSELRFSAGGFSAILTALSGDGRVRVLSAPYVTARSGRRTTLTVGDDTPVLGATTTDQGGAVTQSVEYRSSGVILAVTPRLYRESLQLDLEQEVSAFGRTQTGVNDSPTLTKRNITASLVVPNGEWVALGGLVSGRQDETTSRLFPGGPKVGRSSSDARTELVLLIRVRRAA